MKTFESFMTELAQALKLQPYKLKPSVARAYKPSYRSGAKRLTAAGRERTTHNIKPLDTSVTEDYLLEYEDFIKTLEKLAQTGGELSFRDGNTARIPSYMFKRAVAMYNQIDGRGERLAFSKRLNKSPGDFKAALGFTR